VPLGDGGIVFEARALAQAHPLTSLAKKYVDKVIAHQRLDQPVPEIGIWAGYALTHGYCVRRVEENAAGLVLSTTESADTDLQTLDQEAERIAADLRGDGAGRHILGDEEELITALDRIIAGEVERRLDHWRDSIDDKAWAEMEEYITWWVVKGYALRVAERTVGALT
jgi:hypothetical protein